jgi:iron complex transport system ATP-binding protein
MLESTPLFAKKLTVGYSSNILFEGIDLSVEVGKLTCFMGPNGIGKSTLIRTLSGLQRPLGGEISNLDEKKIALVLTDKITASHMTVYDLVCYGRYPHLGWEISFTSQDHEVVEQSIKEVRIQSLANKKLEELSDGQLQLAMIARALAQETPILLLDEPTAHLDLNNRVEIMKLLLSLARKKNKAIVVATHELDLALQMADNIWLTTPDKKIKTGIPEDLVLDGSFDQIFQFKGFDLKTGKIQHQFFRDQTITLIGSGHEFLWTKNALEREGFLVSDQGKILIKIVTENGNLKWGAEKNSYNTIGGLLASLKNE